MSDNLRLDSHKLIYHPDAVSRWLKGETIYPIEIEISPSGACNHRCAFCAVDYIGYRADFLDKKVILENLCRLPKKGLKSVICSGEGEPLLNKDMPEIAKGLKSAGIDVAMSTNGILFTEDVARECLSSFTWIRFSAASLEENSYKEIQGAKEGDLDKLCKNLENAVSIKRQTGAGTTLGVQCLLLPENAGQLKSMALKLRGIGVDYFTVKPYSQHLQSRNSFSIDYQQMLKLQKELEELRTDAFKVYFRANAMKKIHKQKGYSRCYGLPFMTHIDARGNVWPCVAQIGREGFCYGNLYEQPFEELWEGKKRREVNQRIDSEGIEKICREACRLDEMNQYLSELKSPGEHVNFI